MYEKKGLTQIYCGPGKGKTSVAIGQAIRAVGHGKRAIVIQFLKGRETSRLDYLSSMEPDVRLFRFEKKDKYYEDLTEEEKKKENAVVHIFGTDSLESIEYKEASGEEMSFVKEDDTWEYAPDTTIALTESSMQNMEDAFSDIQAVKEIKNPDDLSDYGFDSPEYNLTLTGKDGEAHKFLIGNASGENYYFMEDGTEKVYTVSADLISEMVWQLADVAEKDSFVTVTSDNFVKETVTKPGDEVKTYEADNEDQEDTVTSIMTALSGFYFTDCADYHVTDATLGNYGLAEDQRTKVELNYKDTSDDDKEKTVTFYVGSKDESATYYYVQMDGSQRVSRVLIDTVEKALGWKVDSSAE